MMKTDTLDAPTFWSRTWRRMKNFAVAMDYDHVQYTNDRMAGLQAQLHDLETQLSQRESGNNHSVANTEGSQA